MKDYKITTIKYLNCLYFFRLNLSTTQNHKTSALVEAPSDLASIISKVPIPIFVWCISEESVHFVNDAFSQRLGYPTEKVLSSDFFATNILHPKDFAAWMLRFEDMKQSKSEDHFKMTFKLKNSAGLYERFNCNVAVSERDENGVPVYLTGTVEDRIQLGILKPNHSKSSLFAQNAVFHCLFDRNLKFIQVCPTFKEHFGEEQPMSLLEWVKPSTAPALYEELYGLFDKHEGDLVFEVEVKNKDQQMSVLRIHLVKRGELSEQLFVIITNITSEKEKALLLEASERQFSQLVNNTSSFSLETDEAGIISYISANVEEILQIRAKDLIGTSLVDLFIDFPIEANKHILDQLTSFKRKIFTIPTANEYSKSVIINANKVQSRDGKITGLRAVIRDISEELLTQEKLKTAEEVGLLCTWEQDLNTGAIYFQRNALRIFGFPEDFDVDHINKYIPLIHPDDRQQVFESSEANIRYGLNHDGHRYTLEYRLVCPNDIKHVLVHCQIDSSNKKEVVIHGVTQDITQIKLSEQKTKEAVQRFEAIVQNSNTWFWEIDEEMRYTFLSENFTEITGYPLEYALGKNVYEFRNQLQLQEVVPKVSEIIRKRKLVSGLKSKYLSASGEEIVVITNAIPKYDSSGKYSGYIGSSRDITEEEKIKAELKASSQKNKTILEAMPDLFFVINDELKIIDYHVPEGGKLWVEPDEFLNKPLLEVFPGPFGEKLTAPVLKAFKTEGVVVDNNERQFDNGETGYFEARYIKIKGTNQVLNIARDVTKERMAIDALQNALSELKTSNEELEQFAYMASHDLQEPVRLIHSYIQLLKKELPAHQITEKTQLYLDFMGDSSVRMRNLIQELLEYSRLGSQRLSMESFSSKELLSAVLLNCSALINQSNAAIEIGEFPETLYCDPIQITRLMQNLISNSIKFAKTNEAPHILISHKSNKNFDVISIQDRGIGIPEKELNRVFQMFARLHPASKYPGNGLGTAIAKKIVEAHDGEIQIESKEQVGTTVSFSIPKAPELQS